MDLTPDTPVRFIPRVGPAMAGKLDILDIRTARDFLYHIPSRYNDFSLVSPISRVRPGETVTIRGTVEQFNAFATKTGKRIQEAKVRDDTGVLSVIWFNQPYLRSVIRPGITIHLAGTISWFGTKIVLSSPEYELFDPADPAASLHTGRLVPVYPLTEGVSSKWIRSRIALLLDTVLPSITELLPETLLTSHHLSGIHEAIRSVHFPKTMEEAALAKRRLAFDELLILQIRAYEQKHQRETKETAHPLPLADKNRDAFLQSLPFVLTHDQNQAVSEVLSDMARTFPMNRLLVGDVGSGKTVVAAIAMYAAHKNKKRSVLMAPTQILAHQHYDTISGLLGSFGISVGLVTADIRGCADVLVGTHALLSKRIKNIGLVVIDEQHRFGVTQRNELMKKGKSVQTPHLLTMTATPIPRTVAKTIMGHMDLSTLFEMPKGRKLIKTWVVPNEKRENAYAWITKQLNETSGQAFIICPLIEESETLASVRAVKKEFEILKPKFPGMTVGLLHGRLKAREKTEVLGAFRSKKTHILVATPVVEVGIDIPNATIMVIEASERFGLSQLHQLRGRVGRGALPSYCLLFTEKENEAVIQRLKMLEKEASGPKLAEADLAIRGAGDILGLRQHGIPNLKIAHFSDTDIIEETQRVIQSITATDPEFSGFPLLREQAQKGTIEATKD